MDKKEYHLSREEIDNSKKRLFWYLILVILLFGVIIFYYFQNSQLQREKVEINRVNANYVEELSELKNKTYATVDTLEGIIDDQQKVIDSLVQQIDETPSPTITKPSKTYPINKIQKRVNITKLNNSRYLIGLQSYGVEAEERAKIGAYFKKNGYTDIQGYNYDDEGAKPDWMSESSVVLYYSADAKAKALEIAKNLTKLTRRTYSIKKGAGLGVIKGQEAYTFFVHNVKL